MISELRTVFVLLLLAVLSVSAHGQEPVLRHFSVDDGLPSSEVYAIEQDQRGDLWFATDRGIVRYDGFALQVYTTDDGLLDNTAFVVKRDPWGRIWFCGQTGKWSYFEDGNLHPLKYSAGTIERGARFAHMCFHTRDSIEFGLTGIVSTRAWLNGEGKLREEGAASHDSIVIYRIEPRQNNQLMCYQEVGASGKPMRQPFRIRWGTSKVDQHVYERLGSAVKLRISSINPDEVAVAFNATFLHLDPDSVAFGHVFDQEIVKVVKDVGDTVWVGLRQGGVVPYIPSRHELLWDQRILIGYSVSDVHRDEEGGLWFSTLEHGVYYLANPAIRHYELRTGVVADRVISLTVDSIHGVLAGTQTGRLWQLLSGKLQEVALPEEIHLPERSSLWLTFVAPDRSLWVNTRNFWRTKLSNHAITILKDSAGIPGKFDGITKVDSGRVVLHSTGRILRANLDGSVQSILKREHGPPSTLPDSVAPTEDITQLHLTPNQHGLWATMYDTVRYLGHAHPLFAAYHVDVRKLDSNTVVGITRGRGVVIITPDRVTVIGKAQGLPSNICTALYVESPQCFWVGTTKGLSRITSASKDWNNCEVSNVTQATGLRSSEIHALNSDGTTLYIGMQYGLSTVPLSALFAPSEPPLVRLDGISINGASDSTRFRHDLKHHQNRINIAYSGRTLRHCTQLIYAYRMLGIDTSWIETQERAITYAGLAPGNYEFNIKARLPDASWGPVKTHHFTIAPPWWQRLSVRVGAGVVTLLLVLIIFRWRVRSVQEKARQENDIQRKMMELEQAALRAQMNPHFTFNTMNAIQSFITSNSTSEAQAYLSKFARLMRMILENSRQKTIALEREVELLRTYLDLEALRFEQPFTYSIKMGSGIDPDFDSLPPMMLQPYLENAIWHGFSSRFGKGHLKLDFARIGNQLQCTIEDNGIGREAAAASKSRNRADHKSMGLMITEERLAAIQTETGKPATAVVEDLVDSAGTPTGTRVVLSLPLL